MKKSKCQKQWYIIIGLLATIVIILLGILIYLIFHVQINKVFDSSLNDFAALISTIGVVAGGASWFSSLKTREKIDKEIEEAQEKTELKLKNMIEAKFYDRFDNVKQKPIIFIYQNRDIFRETAEFFENMGFKHIKLISAEKINRNNAVSTIISHKALF